MEAAARADRRPLLFRFQVRLMKEVRYLRETVSTRDVELGAVLAKSAALVQRLADYDTADMHVGASSPMYHAL